MERHPWFAAFFGFGATMCALTIGLLLFPGTTFDSVWRLNPEAHSAFQSISNWAVVLMTIVGAACVLAAVVLWRGTGWGIRLALVILSFNVLGDLINTTARRDYRALIGLPIAGAMIWYLAVRARAKKV